MNKYHLLMLFFAISVLCGCTTVDVTNDRMKILRSSPDDALLLVSIGRKELPGFFSKQLPFVNYYIFKIEGATLVNKGILASEMPDVTKLHGHLGEGKYGVIHLKELPKGEYLLSSYRRGNSGTVYFVGGIAGYVPGTSDEMLDAVYYIELSPGKINYAGELLMVNDSTEAIEVTDQSKRDFRFVQNQVPEIKESDLVLNFAKRFHKINFELKRAYDFK